MSIAMDLNLQIHKTPKIHSYILVSLCNEPAILYLCYNIDMLAMIH